MIRDITGGFVAFYKKMGWQLLIASGIIVKLHSQSLIRINEFGNNPGNLRMYVYSPASLPIDSTAPLVVVLHGCLQNASTVAKQTGWNQLADKHGFRVLYPQQKILNNPQKCFCWYNGKDIEKGQGEVYSVYQMVQKAKLLYATDSAKVFVTGLSAGAAMSVALMADYPETFNAGAVFAGGPYKAATNVWTGIMAMYGWRVKKPDTWGNYIREQNPAYTGRYPRIIIYHGKIDIVVNRRNATELVKQWTNIHHISYQPTQIIPRFTNNRSIEKRIHCDSTGKTLVTYYRIKGVGHALPVNPGKCETLGGRMGLFSVDKNYYSTYWVAVDFGLIELPQITGKINVKVREEGLTFSVPAKEGSSFLWRVSKNAKIVSGQGTNTIIVKWGEEDGTVDVAEVLSKKCRKAYHTLKVTCEADH
jgi:poly(hydroxyalkanoate) depolymerase family esterase